MAKESCFEGAINDTGVKNKGTSSTGSTTKNGVRGYAGRTNSSRALDEVTLVTNDRLTKPTKN